jgi:hypothetical protein
MQEELIFPALNLLKTGQVIIGHARGGSVIFLIMFASP